jgi:D-amino-acid dehydrogenase
MNQSRPDVVIIGGGAIGLCTAYFLLRRGASVTLLDPDTSDDGTSYGNAGLVVPSHFVPLAAPGIISQGLRWLLNPESPFYIKPRLSLDLIRWLWHFRSASTEAHVERTMGILRDMHIASQKLYETLADTWQSGFEYQRHGLLMLFLSEKGRQSCVHEADLAEALGVEARLLSTAGLRNVEPGVGFHARGGLYFPGDAHLSPAKFMHALVGECHKAGITIIPSSRAEGFEVGSRRITGVRTATGIVRGDTFVLAGGAWSGEIARKLGLRLPLQPGKGYSITLPPLSQPVSVPMILTEARVAVTPFAEGVRFAGTMELAGLDRTINIRRVRAILKAVPKYLDLDLDLNLDLNFNLIPNLDAPRPPGATHAPAKVWVGLRPCAPDGLPYVGRFMQYPNLIAATGHAMIGISLAPVTGRLVAEIVGEEKPSVPTTLMSPDRY